MNAARRRILIGFLPALLALSACGTGEPEPQEPSSPIDDPIAQSIAEVPGVTNVVMERATAAQPRHYRIELDSTDAVAPVMTILCEHPQPNTAHSFLLGTEQRFDAGDVCTLEQQQVEDGIRYMDVGADPASAERHPELITTTVSRGEHGFICSTIVDVTDVEHFKTQLTMQTPQLCDVESRSFYRGRAKSPKIIETDAAKGQTLPDLRLEELYRSAGDDAKLAEVHLETTSAGTTVRLTAPQGSTRDPVPVLRHLRGQGQDLKIEVRSTAIDGDLLLEDGRYRIDPDSTPDDGFDVYLEDVNTD